MNPEPNDDPKKRKDPFDDIFRGMGIDPSTFERMFEEMQKAIGKMLSEGSNFEPGKPYMHGFSFKVGPDGKPTISEFGNRPRKTPNKPGIQLSEEREPPTDVIETKTDVTVTLEMPGVEKDDIDLHVTEDKIEISVETEKRKYHKAIALPTKVKADTTKATYKNGVLDVVVKKKEPSKGGSGLKVKVQ